MPLHPKRALGLFALVAGTGVVAARSHGYLGGLRTAPPVVVSAAPVHVVSDTLRARETVSQLFARQGVNDVDWSALASGVRAFDPTRLRAGLVFMTLHFPDQVETNVLTIDATDPKSGTAEFKATAVRIEKLPTLAAAGGGGGE